MPRYVSFVRRSPTLAHSCRSKVPPFTQAFDLRDGVEGTTVLSTSVLKQYDIVCVEALIHRFPKKTGNYSSGWKEWRMSLDLSRLFLLHSVDAGMRVEVDNVLF